jgi:hypothetical protein
MKTFTIKMHAEFSQIDKCPLFCFDILDEDGRVVKYTKWQRHEQDNVTLALRELLDSGTPTGPAWHNTPETDREFVSGQRHFG